jgi:3-hydroxybutyrate dehydrogenase
MLQVQQRGRHDAAGKRAIVTGSNSGIGLGVAEALAAAGADVVLNSFTDRPEDHAIWRRAWRAARGDGALHRRRHVEGADCRALIEKAGGCDILVNNAGIQFVAPIEFPGREMGCDPGDQPVLGLPHHRRRLPG